MSSREQGKKYLHRSHQVRFDAVLLLHTPMVYNEMRCNYLCCVIANYLYMSFFGFLSSMLQLQ